MAKEYTIENSKQTTKCTTPYEEKILLISEAFHDIKSEINTLNDKFKPVLGFLPEKIQVVNEKPESDAPIDLFFDDTVSSIKLIKSMLRSIIDRCVL